MQLNLPITEQVYEQVKLFRTNKQSHVVFTLDGLAEGTLFILAHGTERGNICVNGYELTSEQLLRGLLADGIKNMGYKKVETVSCYGGLQKEVTIDGVTISSSHECKEEINVNYMQTIDGKCYLVLEIGGR